MLRALIVDDEILARKGIIGLVDWHKYGIEVVGEAENGREALSFLQENDVQVLFTDLSMPGVSGMEYIKQVRERFPKIKIVVLTMLQDFELLQQAMRIGVIDYITKAQIENGNLDFIMNNVLKQIKVHNIYAAIDVTETCETESCFIAYGGGENIDNAIASFSLDFIKFDEGLYISQYDERIPIDSTDRIGSLEQTKVILIKIIGVKNYTFHNIIDRFNHRIIVDLFYKYIPGCSLYEFSFDIEDERAKKVLKEILLKQFKDLSWVFDGKIYEKQLVDLISLRMSHDELSMFCYQLYVGWAPLIDCSPIEYFDNVSGFIWWADWHAWLCKNRELLKGKMPGNTDNRMNELAIQNALTFIRTNFQEEIQLEDLLKLTNMSKSHFCKQFKKINGCTFLDFAKNYRISRAKEYLTNTNQPVSWVAEQVGYPNERYFRKVFIEVAGKTPTSYRNSLKIV